MSATLAVRCLGPTAYRDADALQRALHGAASGDDYLLLLEHPHVYTLGSRADRANLLTAPEDLGAFTPGERAHLIVMNHHIDRDRVTGDQPLPGLRALEPRRWSGTSAGHLSILPEPSRVTAHSYRHRCDI